MKVNHWVMQHRFYNARNSHTSEMERSTTRSMGLPPVIFKIADAKPNFKLMSLTEMKAIAQSIEEQAGKPKSSTLARGGDLFIFPTDSDQQENLLKITSTAGRQVQTALPRSLDGKKGIIYVPVTESIDVIKEELASQGVSQAVRFQKMIDGSPTDTDTVCLTFQKEIPASVHLAAIIFPVKPFIPSPFRCTRCWRLGHTARHCSSPHQHCSKCGKAHDDTITCEVFVSSADVLVIPRIPKTVHLTRRCNRSSSLLSSLTSPLRTPELNTRNLTAQWPGASLRKNLKNHNFHHRPRIAWKSAL
jgi:hypothetical protein